MQVRYEDEDEEDLILANEKIKFFVSPEEMQHLNLRYGVKIKIPDGEVQDFDEMVALAAGLEDFQDFQTRDIVWAKLAGECIPYLCLLKIGETFNLVTKSITLKAVILRVGNQKMQPGHSGGTL